MQVNHGKVQNYLDMKLYYTTVSQVKIVTLNYINEIIDTFDKVDPTGVVTKPSASPAIIFMVDKYCKNNKYQASCGVSSPGGKHIICYQAGQVKHMHHSFITHQNSERTWKWWLGQVVPSNEKNQGHKEIYTYPEWQREWYTKMMDLWIVCFASKHDRAHWWWYINRKIIYHLYFKKTESENMKLHLNWDCIIGWLYAWHNILQYYMLPNSILCLWKYFFQDNKLLFFWKSTVSIKSASAQRT